MLEVLGVSKSYGAVRALDGVSLQFEPGEIHAVLGENGAGKSTLMHVMSGFTSPDSGTVKLDGRTVPIGRPHDCRRLGIAMIHQHFTLVPAFTVEENFALAGLHGFGVANVASLAAASLERARSLKWKVAPGARTGDLPVGVQQRIEILKSVSEDSRVVIFDEPTAVLSAEEVADLFRVLERLREGGRIVILIAHKLREVMAIANRVSVLRQGRVIAQGLEVGNTSAEQLARMMVGELPPALQKPRREVGNVAVSMRQVRAKGDRGEEALRGIDLQVRAGEILGIGGVDGNGQVELAEVLARVRRCSSGEIEVPARTAYIPQDRQSDGLALTMSVEDNLLVAALEKPGLSRGPFLRPGPIRTWAQSLVAKFDIRASSVKEAVACLSGGNQQKVVVARALDSRPELLIAVNPTRGLDVKATEFVHRAILSARAEGAAVVLISTDLDELAAVADRTVFLSAGAIVEGEGAASLVGGGS